MAADAAEYEHILYERRGRVVTHEGNAIREQRRMPAHAEAVAAFVEKREPRFH